jgi:hypothetical protein
MEDGPEDAEGTYSYGANTYTLRERESEKWEVRAPDGQLIGTVSAVPGPDRVGPLYAVEVPGETETEDVPTEDWRAAVEYIIGQSAG